MPEARQQSLFYDVYISNDNVTWTIIALALTTTSLIYDTVLYPAGDSYKIKIVAYSNDLIQEDESDAPFSIAGPDKEGIFEQLLSTITDSSNWFGLGAVGIVGLGIGALTFGLIGKKKK